VAAQQLPNPNSDLSLKPLKGDARPLHEWLTTFNLASVVLDPYTNESSWILPTAVRILNQFRGADVRVNFIIACGADEARTFLGPLADEFLVFPDEDRSIIKALGLSELPAFVVIQTDGTIPANAQGWNAAEWKAVAEYITKITKWTPPAIPAPGDPGSFRGTPALV
jgi:hypothetical protein